MCWGVQSYLQGLPDEIHSDPQQLCALLFSCAGVSHADAATLSSALPAVPIQVLHSWLLIDYWQLSVLYPPLNPPSLVVKYSVITKLLPSQTCGLVKYSFLQGGKCQGEIGPGSAESKSALHMYTSSFAFLRHSSLPKAMQELTAL